MTEDHEVKHVVWIPFGRNDPQCVDDPSWWDWRADVMSRVTLQSLYNQDRKGFQIWVCIMYDLREKAAGMISFLKKNHPLVRIVIDPRNCPGKKLPYSPEPYEAIRNEFDESTDLVVMTRIDSDDAFLPGAMEKVWEAKHQEGSVGYFGGGWVMNPERGLWAKYNPPKPMAYYSMSYSRDMVINRDQFEESREKYKMNLYHHQLARAVRPINYGDGLILHHDCGRNVVGSWERWEKRGHIGDPLFKEEINDLIEKTGIQV